MSEPRTIEANQLLIASPQAAASELDHIEKQVTDSGGVVVGGAWRQDLVRPGGGVLDAVRQLADWMGSVEPVVVQRYGRVLATALPDRFQGGPLAGPAEVQAKAPDFPLRRDRSALIEFYQRRNWYFLTRSHLVYFVLSAADALAAAGRGPTLLRVEGAEQADRLTIEILHLLHHYGTQRGTPLILALQAEHLPPGWDEVPTAIEWSRRELESSDESQAASSDDVSHALLAASVFSHPFGAEELARLTGASDAQQLLTDGVDKGWLRQAAGSNYVVRSSATLASWTEALRAEPDQLARLHATALDIEAADPFAAAWHARLAGLEEEAGTKSSEAMKRAWGLSAYEAASHHARWALESPALEGVDPDLLYGLLHFEAEEYPETDRLLTACWERQDPESVHHADLQWLVGYNAIFGLEEFDRGRQLLESVLDRFEREGMVRECGYLRNSIAYALFRTRRLDNALQAENEVIEYARASDHPDNFLLSLLQLNRGRLHRTLGDSDVALSEFENGIRGQNAGLSPYMLTLFHCSSGHLRMSRGDYGDALLHYHHTLNLVRGLEIEAAIDRMLYSISRHASKLSTGRANRGDLMLLLMHLNLALASRGLGLERYEAAYRKALDLRRDLVGDDVWKALTATIDELEVDAPSQPPERVARFDADAEAAIEAVDDLIHASHTGDAVVDAVVDALDEGLAVAVLIPHPVGPVAARVDSFVLHDPRRPVTGALNEELFNTRLSALSAPRSALTLPERVDLFNDLEPLPLILQEKDLRHDQRQALPGLFPVQTRVQVLDPDFDGLLYRVVARFAERTGCGVVAASPFHLLGRPDLAADPREAVHDFLISSSDALLLGDRLLVKRQENGRQQDLLPFRPHLNGLSWRVVTREASLAGEGSGSGDALFLHSHAPGASRQLIKVRSELVPLLEMCNGKSSVEEIIERAHGLDLIPSPEASGALCGFLRQLWLQGILCFDDPPVADAVPA